jgi:hypothetical protein
MDLAPYLASLRESLASAASLGDDQTKQTAAALAAAVEPAARLALLHALSDLAAEITAEQDDYLVEVRLDGTEARVVVTPTSATPEPESTFGARDFKFDANGDISRVTVRMVEEIKAAAERAAATQGVSLNSFVSQAVASALAAKNAKNTQSADNRKGARLHGWVTG